MTDSNIATIQKQCHFWPTQAHPTFMHVFEKKIFQRTRLHKYKTITRDLEGRSYVEIMENYVFKHRDQSIMKAPIVDFYFLSFVARIEKNVFFFLKTVFQK